MGRLARPGLPACLSQVHDCGVLGTFAVRSVVLLLPLLLLRSCAGERLPLIGDHSQDEPLSKEVSSNATVRSSEHSAPIHRGSHGHRAPGATGAVAMTAKGGLLVLPSQWLNPEAALAARMLEDALGQEEANATTRPLRLFQVPHHWERPIQRRATPAIEVPAAAAPVGPLWRLILAVAGGTGASVHEANLMFRAELMRRMRLQDIAVMLLMLSVYLLLLLITASVTHHQAANSSRVTYYGDPRYHAVAMEGDDLEAFVDNFTQNPKGVYLTVAGLAPTVQDLPGTYHYRGDQYRVDFTFALDLSPWVVRESGLMAASGHYNSEPALQLQDGAVAEDLEKLRHFLAHDSNDLAIVEVEKEISWPRWEELATNIKHQIRQCEYQGLVGVDRTRHECLRIFKNKQWANFLHSRTLKVVLALSVLGWILYLPYMWLRTTTLRVRCFYQVSIGIDDYWPLISNGLCAHGYRAPEPRDRRIGHQMFPVPADDEEVFYDPREEDSDSQ